jgi:hypothetical protein
MRLSGMLMICLGTAPAKTRFSPRCAKPNKDGSRYSGYIHLYDRTDRQIAGGSEICL